MAAFDNDEGQHRPGRVARQAASWGPVPGVEPPSKKWVGCLVLGQSRPWSAASPRSDMHRTPAMG